MRSGRSCTDCRSVDLLDSSMVADVGISDELPPSDHQPDTFLAACEREFARLHRPVAFRGVHIAAVRRLFEVDEDFVEYGFGDEILRVDCSCMLFVKHYYEEWMCNIRSPN